MLGESILSLLIIEPPEEDGKFFSVFYCSLLNIILLQYLHFRSQPHHADGHATRRNKDAGTIWAGVQFVYSSALVTLGSAFTLLLINVTSSGSRRLTTSPDRQLSGTIQFNYDPDELRQRAAYMYSASLALVFFSLDVMSLLHVGLENGKNRCVCKHTHKKNVKGFILIAVRAGLIAFVATLGQWMTDPEVLVGIGLAFSLFEVVTRALGQIIFPAVPRVHAVTSSDDHQQHKQESVEDPEGDKWPNTTHARAETPVEANARAAAWME